MSCSTKRKNAVKILYFTFFLFGLFLVFSSKSFAINTCAEGWQINMGEEKTINCHSVCRKVKNNNCPATIFVPTRSYEEWKQFLDHSPSCVLVSLCSFAIWVAKEGSGSGVVISSPPGINCGSNCYASFPANSQVTLSVSPSSDSVFGGWLDDCVGTNPTCTLIMNSHKSVTAIFNPNCKDDCLYFNDQRSRCFGNYDQESYCGLYDDDPCMDWSPWITVENCDDYDQCIPGWSGTHWGGYFMDYYCEEIPVGGVPSARVADCVYSVYCTERCCDWYFGDSRAYCSLGICYPPPP